MGWSKKEKELIDTDNIVVIAGEGGVGGPGRGYQRGKC